MAKELLSHPESYLKKEFDLKKKRNAGFSLRTFSRKVGVSPTTLSNVFSGKRRLSSAAVERISDALNIPSEKKEALISSVGLTRTKSTDLLSRRNSRHEMADKMVIRPDFLGESSLWHTFAVLECLSLEELKNDPEKIGKKVGICKKVVENIIKACECSGILVREKDGKLSKRKEHLLVEGFTHGKSLRHLHSNGLKRAADHLQHFDSSERYFGTEIFAFSADALPEAKEIINHCLDELIALSRRQKNTSTLFQASVQFFDPTTKETIIRKDSK